MKLQRKCHPDLEAAHKWDQKEIDSSGSEYDSDSFATPIISAGIKIDDCNINIIRNEKTPHISASQELFTKESIKNETNCQINNCMLALTT